MINIDSTQNMKNYFLTDFSHDLKPAMKLYVIHGYTDEEILNFFCNAHFSNEELINALCFSPEDKEMNAGLRLERWMTAQLEFAKNLKI